MGCDIHAFVEVKKNGKWHTYSEADLDRDYGLFAKMADVRNYSDWDIKPISKPRGLPEDTAEITKFESDNWDSDGHSHSWLSKEEIQEILEWAKEQKAVDTDYAYNLRRKFGYKLTDLEDYDQYEDSRLVFWFDN